jgi:RNA polymerase sigma-70 factor (family 1)
MLFTKSRPFSEELVQDIFLKIWLNREKLREVQQFDGYLFITARNHIYSALRTKVREVEFRDELKSYFADSSLADDQLHLKEAHALIHTAMEQLPPQQRSVFELSRFQGLSHEEIAEQLQISPLTVRAHMRKALAFMRTYLQQHSGELSLGPVIYFLLVK